jgi:hypothetical protein
MPPAIFAAFAALVGVIIGGVSVLGVVVAVAPSPSRDAPVGSAVFDGPHVVDERQAPPAQPAPPPAQPAPAQALPATPAQEQTPSSADVLRHTWPASSAPAKPKQDAPSARSQRAPDQAAGTTDGTAATTDQTPATSPPAAAPNPNVRETAVGNKDSKNNSGSDVAKNSSSPDVATKGTHEQRRAGHLATSRNPAPLSLAPNAPQTSRRSVTPPVNDQQARGDVGDEASPQAPRPLFDFFGRPDDRYDYRDTPDTDTDTHSLPQPVQTGRFVYGRNQIVRQQPRVIGQDQDTASPPAQNDNWGGFFGHDNWNDDRRD